MVEDLAEPPVAVSGLAGSSFPAGDVVPRAHADARSQVCSGRKPAHVHADLGDDALRCAFADARDRVESVTGCRERGDHPIDFEIKGGDGGFEMGDMIKYDSRHDGVMVSEAAVQRFA